MEENVGDFDNEDEDDDDEVRAALDETTSQIMYIAVLKSFI